MPLKFRDTQTQVKHIILSDYLDAWAGFIINGLSWRAKEMASRGIPFRCRLMYVDGFAHKGRYAGDTGEVLRKGIANTPTWGSPILGILALDRAREFAQRMHGLRVEIAAVLSELESETFRDLEESIALAGLSQRLILNPEKLAPSDGDIIAIQGDCLKHWDDVVRLAKEPYTYSLILLDPYGPRGIPYLAVSCVIALQRTDVMINFPYYDLHKKQGILARAEEKPADQALLANIDAMFGTTEWRDVRQRAAEGVPAHEVGRKVEQALASFYLKRLQEADPALAVKHIELQFRDRDRTMFYLFLTTHDPSGALALNQVLYNAKLTEYELKWDLQQAKWVHEALQMGQDFLFGPEEGEPSPPPLATREVDIPALADFIWRQCRGHTRSWRQVYTMLANSDVFASDVGRALTHLKRRKLAEYEKQQMDALIRFNGAGGQP